MPGKIKTKEEVMREFNAEKWGSILENLLSDPNKKLEDIDMVMESFNEDKTFFYKKKFFLGTGKEVFDLHIDLYKEFLKDHLEDVSCLVELGAGYGSKNINERCWIWIQSQSAQVKSATLNIQSDSFHAKAPKLKIPS